MPHSPLLHENRRICPFLPYMYACMEVKECIYKNETLTISSYSTEAKGLHASLSLLIFIKGCKCVGRVVWKLCFALLRLPLYHFRRSTVASSKNSRKCCTLRQSKETTHHLRLQMCRPSCLEALLRLILSNFVPF